MLAPPPRCPYGQRRYGIFDVYITLYVLGKIALFMIDILGYTVVFSEPPQMFEFAAFMGARPLFIGAGSHLIRTLIPILTWLDRPGRIGLWKDPLCVSHAALYLQACVGGETLDNKLHC